MNEMKDFVRFYFEYTTSKAAEYSVYYYRVLTSGLTCIGT